MRAILPLLLFFAPLSKRRTNLFGATLQDANLQGANLRYAKLGYANLQDANLRVADASIMPRIINANTNAPSMMIGERCADFVQGRTTAVREAEMA